MPDPRPTKTLTVFLGREACQNPSELLTEEARAEAEVYPLTRGRNFTGEVYLPAPRRNIPHWIQFLNSGLQNPLPNHQTAGLSAVMVLRHENRLFAFTFGHTGRSMMYPGSYELDFGLKVVLNRVDAKQIRSIDTKNYEDIIISTRKQTSRSSELGTFELDISRDLLRGVVGDPVDKTFFKRIASADAVVVTTELELADLGDLCAELLDAYHSKNYRKNFNWVDRVKQVRDPALIEVLDERLLTALKDHQTGAMHLAPADVLDWEKVEEFAFTGSGQRQVCSYPELTLAGYLDTLGPQKHAALDGTALRRHRVRVKYSNLPEPVEEFTVYECLVWDTSHGGRRYALMDGRWFEIEKSFAERVLRLAAELHQSDHAL